MSSASRGSKRSERSGGSGNPDAESIRRAIEAQLNSGDRSKFGIGELEPIAIPGIGEVWTDGLQPVDPTDCQRWPDSFACTEWQPSSPRGNPIGRIVKIAGDKCTVFITIDFSVGPFKMPSITIAKKISDAPECLPLPPEDDAPIIIEETEKEELGEPGQLIYLELRHTVEETGACDGRWANNSSESALIYNLDPYVIYPQCVGKSYDFLSSSVTKRYVSCDIDSIRRPINFKKAYPAPITIWKTTKREYRVRKPVIPAYTLDSNAKLVPIGSLSPITDKSITEVVFTYYQGSTEKNIYFGEIPDGIENPTPSSYVNYFLQMAKLKFESGHDKVIGHPKVDWGYGYCSGWAGTIQQLSVNGSPIETPPYNPPAKPNLNPPPLPPMNCCASVDAQLRLTREIHKSLRADMFGKGEPAVLPERMVRPGKTGTVKLHDYIDVFEFLVRYFDRLIGMAPWSVLIEDTDPVKEGNQSITTRFESIGEMLRSLLEVEANKPIVSQQASGESADGLSESIINMRTLFNMAHAILQEVGVTHKIVAEVRAELDEQTEGLGYDVKDAIVGVPFAFSPLRKALQDAYSGSEEELKRLIPALLTPSTVNVTYSQNRDKKTLYQMLADISDRLKLLEGANTTRVKSHAHFKQILEGMEVGMDAAQLLLLRQIKQALGAVDKNALQDFMDILEKRYTEGTSPVTTDEGKPYQQSRSNEPKIVVQEQKPQK